MAEQRREKDQRKGPEGIDEKKQKRRIHDCVRQPRSRRKGQ